MGLMFLEVKQPMGFPGSELFHSTKPGDLFITLDDPFVIMMGGDKNIKNDAGAGVKVVYCLQYKLGGVLA